MICEEFHVSFRIAKSVAQCAEKPGPYVSCSHVAPTLGMRDGQTGFVPRHYHAIRAGRTDPIVERNSMLALVGGHET